MISTFLITLLFTTTIFGEALNQNISDFNDITVNGLIDNSSQSQAIDATINNNVIEIEQGINAASITVPVKVELSLQAQNTPTGFGCNLQVGVDTAFETVSIRVYFVVAIVVKANGYVTATITSNAYTFNASWPFGGQSPVYSCPVTKSDLYSRVLTSYATITFADGATMTDIMTLNVN